METLLILGQTVSGLNLIKKLCDLIRIKTNDILLMYFGKGYLARRIGIYKLFPEIKIIKGAQ